VDAAVRPADDDPPALAERQFRAVGEVSSEAGPTMEARHQAPRLRPPTTSGRD
jgi:hypothetical protein